MDLIRGVNRSMPFTGFMMAAGTLAIIGAPPFAVFVGELTLMSASIDAGMTWVTVLSVVLLAIVFAGFVRHIFPMLTGDAGRDIEKHACFSRHAPLAVLFICTLLMGLFMPDTVSRWLDNVVTVLSGVM